MPALEIDFIPAWDEVDPAAVLALPVENDNDPGYTIKTYLYELLAVLWREQADFSGKRPFGNSGWEYDLYVPLIKAKMVTGELDEDGFIETIDSDSANRIIDNAIYYVFHGQNQPRRERRVRT
jgi:hypothetical protein